MLVLAAMSAAFVLGAAETVNAAPGATLYVYNSTNEFRPAPDAEPITVIVDKGNGFSYGNLVKNAETKNLNGQRLFLVWKGYIQIPAAGVYTFSASFAGRNNSSHNVFILLNNKDFLNIYQNVKGVSMHNASKSVSLVKGHYELMFVYKAQLGCPNVTLKMWNKKSPLKKFAITPASMAHAE